MEKEFVPYELALKMKQLGFDEPCWGYYDVNDGYSTGYAFCYSDRESQPEIGCSAPLYQQAFRWFRDEHNLSGIPTHQAYEVWNTESSTCFIESYPLDSFEEAEIACLTVLIEIIEQDKKK